MPTLPSVDVSRYTSTVDVHRAYRLGRLWLGPPSRNDATAVASLYSQRPTAEFLRLRTIAQAIYAR